MTKHAFWVILFVFLLISPSWALNLQEIEVNFGVNTMSFDPETGSFNPNEVFEGTPFFFGDFILKFGINDNTGLNFHFSRDPILWNSLYAGLTLNTEFVRMEFGPLIGFGYDSEKPIIGLSGGFAFSFPGIFFLTLDGSSSFISDVRHEFTGGTRESARLRFGFWTPNVIPYFTFEYKSFRRHDESNILDELLRAMISFDIFAKNFPAVFILNAGCDILSRTVDLANDQAEEITAAFAGMELRWQLTHPLRLNVGFEIPYVLNMRVLDAPQDIMFKAYAGFTWRFF